MSKKIFVDAFYDQYEDFLQQMITVFPSDPEWPRYKTAVAVFRRANPMNLVVKTWECVSPFETAIHERNDAFFLEQEVPDGPLTHTIVKLKLLWEQLDAHNQSVVWDYIRNITYLAKKCSAA
jgi:hypothetical protein